MSDDLTRQQRDAGHEDVATAHENRELVGRLRKSGRDDLADALEAGHPTPAEEAEPNAKPTPSAPHEQLAQQLQAAQSKWLILGGPGEPKDDTASA